MNKKWVYLGMLIVSAVGFVVDRLFLSTPQLADAEEVVRQPSPKPPAAAPKRPDSPPNLDPSLSWLAKLTDQGPGRDVFAPSPAWLTAQQEAAQAEKEAAEAAGPKPGSPEAFQAGHQLQATTVISNGGLAVVDGQCLSVGDTLEDFTLARVAAGEVEFRRDKDRVTLTLPMGPAWNAKRTGPASASASSPSKETAGSTGPSQATPAPQPAPKWGLLRKLLGGKSQSQ